MVDGFNHVNQRSVLMEKRNEIQFKTLLLPYWKGILLSTLTALVAAAASFLNPLIMKQMIDTALPNKDIPLLSLSVIGIVLLPIFSTIFQSITKMIHNRIGGEISDQLNNMMFSRLLHLSPRILNTFHVGDIAVRLDRVDEVGDFFIKWHLLPAFAEVLSTIGLVVIMIRLDWKLALISFSLLPIIVIVASRLGQKVEDNFKVIIALRKKIQGHAVQLLGGIKTVQMMTREEQERAYKQENLKQFRQIRNATFMIQTWRYELSTSLEKALGLAIIFSASIWFILKGQMTLGILLAYTVYFPNFLGSVKSIRSLYMHYKEIKPKLQEVQEILNLPIEIQDSSYSQYILQARGEITFQHVSFSYGENRGEIKDISFQVKPGEFIGIVGPTGAGKSTILDLLLRFYDPDEGEICLDGKNIKDYKVYDLRNRIGMVSQEVFLWDKSIKENLLYAKPDATEEEVQKACKIAQMTEFLDRFPLGLDTLIGERGVKLSGGEKQRLGIARIILRQPQILLMDEPTSALDAKTEALLQNELENIFKNRTMIVVAHRLATIRNSDRILVVSESKVAEMGTHQELMMKKGIYHQLFMEQMRTTEFSMFLNE